MNPKLERPYTPPRRGRDYYEHRARVARAVRAALAEPQNTDIDPFEGVALGGDVGGVRVAACAMGASIQEVIANVARDQGQVYRTTEGGWLVGDELNAVFVPSEPSLSYGRGLVRVGTSRASSAGLALQLWEAIEKAEARGGDATIEVIFNTAGTGKAPSPEADLMAQIVQRHACRFTLDPGLTTQWMVGGEGGEGFLRYPQRASATIARDGSVRWSGVSCIPEGPLVWDLESMVLAYCVAQGFGRPAQAVAA